MSRQKSFERQLTDKGVNKDTAKQVAEILEKESKSGEVNRSPEEQRLCLLAWSQTTD